MHEYTYVGIFCDTDVIATLMEMRAGELCVMIGCELCEMEYTNRENL